MAEDDDQDRYWMRGTGSEKSSTPKGRSLTSMSKVQAAQHRSDWITKCALQVLGSYRKDDFADPDSYLVQLGMVLERYGDEIIREVTSPVTGIQRTCKFPPSIAEVVEFIDEMVRRKSFAATYDARSRKQLEERAEYERLDKEEPLEHRRAAAERILAEYHAARTPDTKPQRQTWQRFSTEDLLKKYPPKHPPGE